MKTRHITSSIIISLALLGTTSSAETVATTKTETQTESQETRSIETLVKPISDKVIVPLYKEAAEQSDKLYRSTIAFCAEPNKESLAKLRTQWSEALSAWQATEIASFGPALERQRDLHIYFRPVKKRVIKGLWSSKEALTLDAVNFAGVGAKGFATLEYLISDRELSDKETLARFNRKKTPRHCEHLIAVSTLLQEDINAISSAWQTDYPATLEQSEEAMSLILGKLDQTTEAVANKLRQALAKDAHLAGKDEFREKRNAHKLEAWRSGHTLQNIQANLSGVKQVLNDGGLLAWLRTHQQVELANQLTAKLNEMQAIEFPGDDLFELIEAGKLKAADALFEDAITLSKLIKDMAEAMDIQLGFNDNDGD
ncbi:hypothetical protein EOL70_16460 [Leucothrix sargassi]|nr:hypothetical protein EOL70_16460 [Leucothrix sargassi]